MGSILTALGIFIVSLAVMLLSFLVAIYGGGAVGHFVGLWFPDLITNLNTLFHVNMSGVDFGMVFGFIFFLLNPSKITWKNKN